MVLLVRRSVYIVSFRFEFCCFETSDSDTDTDVCMPWELVDT